MRTFFKYHDVDEWECGIENMVGPGWFKANRIIGIILNIVVPIVCLLVFKVGFIEFLLCFLIFDMLMVVLNCLSVKTWKIVRSLSWLKQKADYKKKVSDMTLEEINHLKKVLGKHNEFYQEKLDILNEQIAEYKRLDTIATPVEHRDTIRYVQEIVDKMRAYSDDNIPFDECEERIDWIQERMAKIVKESDELLAIVHDEPENIVSIVNTYNVYAEEMLNIILKYQEADEEQQEKMRPKLENLLDTFSNKLDRLLTKITSSRERSLDMDMDYLAKRLNEDVEK